MHGVKRTDRRDQTVLFAWTAAKTAVRDFAPSEKVLRKSIDAIFDAFFGCLRLGFRFGHRSGRSRGLAAYTEANSATAGCDGNLYNRDHLVHYATFRVRTKNK